MKNKEVIDWLKSIKDKYIHGGDDAFDEKRKEAVDIAINELKQKEKKAQWEYDNKTVVCSNCQTWYNISDRLVFMRYCPYCGRKMKWGD